MQIALLGAAGAIGQSVSNTLCSNGRSYRVAGRNREQLERSFGSDPLAEIVTWNPNDPESVRAAVRGMDALVYLVGVPYNQFQLHPQLMRATLTGAIAEQVERILLVGTVYPYGRPQMSRVTEQHPREPHTFKGRMRKEQEDILLEADAAGRVRATILRLPDFYGPAVDKSFLHLLFQAAAQGGTANLIGPIDKEHEFVYVPDVGRVLVSLLEKPEAYGHWWNLAGAGAITQRAVAEQVFAMVGRKPKMRVVGKTGLRILGLFNPFMRELVEMHYLMTTPVLLDDSALLKLLGHIEKTPYPTGFERTLDEYKRLAMKN